MTTDYSKYVDEIKELKEKLKNKLKKDLETEFSKSLEMKVIIQRYIISLNIFLIADDYGIIFEILNNERPTSFYANIYTVIKNNSPYDCQWHISSYKNYVTIDPLKEDIEEFVKNYIKKIKSRYIILKKSEATREFNKSVKKYNL